jgi:hypothetical protein
LFPSVKKKVLTPTESRVSLHSPNVANQYPPLSSNFSPLSNPLDNGLRRADSNPPLTSSTVYSPGVFPERRSKASAPASSEWATSSSNRQANKDAFSAESWGNPSASPQAEEVWQNNGIF